MTDKKFSDDIAEIADYHIKQKGVVAFQTEDMEIFMFTVDTLKFLLEKAEQSAEKKAVVAIPRSSILKS